MPADNELCEWLEDEGVGTVGTDIFAGSIPAGVEDAIGLTQYPGQVEETCGSDGITIELPRLQVHVRNASEATALSKAKDCMTALTKISNQNVESVYYRGVVALQSVGLLFRDDNNRPHYGFNIVAEKVPS